MIDAVFFDFDGVLTLEGRGSTVTIRAIQEARPDLSPQAIEESYYRLHTQMLLGPKDHAAMWDEFCALVGAQIDPSVLTTAFLATPMNKAMLELARALTPACQVGIITTNATDRMAALIPEYGLDELFDPIVISAEVGCFKTNSVIFEHALDGKNPERCVFIDNHEENLTVPDTLGFKTYLFDPRGNDIAGLKSQLSEWGVPSNGL